MKLRGPIFFSVLTLILVLCVAYNPLNQYNKEKEAILMQTIMGGMNQLHYRPQVVNDGFSMQVYDLYLDRIDGAKRWLTKEDLAVLKPFASSLDDQAKAGNYSFFEKSIEILNNSIDKTQTYYKEILSKPFDYTKSETVELDSDKKGFAKNDEELYDYWRKTLKYETIVRLTSKMEEQDKAGKDELKTKDVLEQEAREAVLEMFDDWYTRMKKRRRSDYLSQYLNTFTNVFDPHSGYYEPADKENFDIGMSGTLEGIGARLQTDGEYTKVADVIPGGPAWKTKQLEENDIITKVTQGTNTDEAVDVTGYRIDDVVKLIRGKKGTEVTLTIKKVDGSMQDITIIRDVVQLEESYAKSAILNSKDSEDKIGYIKLPRFYADFSNSNGRSCAKDVAKELEKLKAENVDGIILDLRNNGGGSLRDVVKMSGLFIEEGPIVQVKSRNRQPDVLKDEDPKVQYDGNLIVMVNSFSASASEILAAALQDYDRAVIVGSPSTFGKGTVQRFFDLDRAIRGNDDVKPLGEVKLTIQKFYRVNGGSTQLRGVQPDIILPDRYHYMEIGEREYDHAMQWTEIDPVTYSQNVVTLDNLESIKKNSTQRVNENEMFQKVLANAKRLKEQNERSNYPLNLDDYRTQEKKREAEAEEFKDMFSPIEDLVVQNLAVDKEYINAEESRQAANEDWMESMQKDIYIKETLNIMQDMLN